MLGLIVLVILVILVLGLLPTWPYTTSYGYGYWPSGILFVILLIVVLLLFTGHLGTMPW
jgi:uncharacterized protein DUF3309